jgi:hypothetical protein
VIRARLRRNRGKNEIGEKSSKIPFLPGRTKSMNMGGGDAMSDQKEEFSNVRQLSRQNPPRVRAPGPETISPAETHSLSTARPSVPAVVSFDRRELGEILRLYGRKVAAGEWRDYAIDFAPQRAVFSIFRRTSEAPLFRVEKNPALARKQGAYSVVAATGMILRRGNDLARVISVLDKAVRLVRP